MKVKKLLSDEGVDSYCEKSKNLGSLLMQIKEKLKLSSKIEKFLTLFDITTGIQLDYKQEKEKLKHFYSMLGVVKVNKQKNCLH